MDIKRKKNLPLRRLRLAAVTTVIIAVVSGIGFGLSRLKSAAPTVDRNVTLTDVVKRGSMLRLQPEPRTRRTHQRTPRRDRPSADDAHRTEQPGD